MENYLFLAIAFVFGSLLAFFWTKLSFAKLLQTTKDEASVKLGTVEKELLKELETCLRMLTCHGSLSQINIKN